MCFLQKREDLLKDLSCAVEEDSMSTSNIISTSVTTDVANTDQDTISDLTTEETITTEHEDDINQTKFIKSTPIPYVVKSFTQNKIFTKQKSNKVILNKNINLDIIHNNNLQSNDIPKIAGDEPFIMNEHLEKLEDEKNMQHKMLHDELARLGNLDTIFTQPTDHFVPPLVMARAKISDDMTVLSLVEKHAQQLAEKHKSHSDDNYHAHVDDDINSSKTTTENVQTSVTTDSPIVKTARPFKIKDSFKKDKIKSNVPKKYNDKQYDTKNKVTKSDIKIIKSELKVTELPLTTQTETTVTLDTTTKRIQPLTTDLNKSEDDPVIDLTVIIKDPPQKDEKTFAGDVPKIEVIENDTTISNPEIKLINSNNTNGVSKQEISVKIPARQQNLTLGHEVIKITIINEENSSITPTVFEITTKMPMFEDFENSTTLNLDTTVESTKVNITDESTSQPPDLNEKTTKENKASSTTTGFTIKSTTTIHVSTEPQTVKEQNVSTTEQVATTTETTLLTTTKNVTDDTIKNTNESSTTTVIPTTIIKDGITVTPEDENLERNTTDTGVIDDFQSPLLSAANEPLHRPNRSRRPQQQPSRINKFNPFRILG